MRKKESLYLYDHIHYKNDSYNQKFDYIGQREFIEMWSKSAFHFNLDPSDIHPGNQIMQTAAVGCINIGGLNESHSIMYPNSATCDEKILEEVFVEYLKDDNKRFEAISFAWEKLNEIYSYRWCWICRF